MANTYNIFNITFYRNNYRILSWLSIVLLIIAFIILAYIFYDKISAPTSKYFATTSDGYLIEIQPKN